MKPIKSLPDWIKFFLRRFEDMTQDEADFAEEICKWEDEKRMAFIMAKKIFEDKENE